MFSWAPLARAGESFIKANASISADRVQVGDAFSYRVDVESSGGGKTSSSGKISEDSDAKTSGDFEVIEAAAPSELDGLMVIETAPPQIEDKRWSQNFRLRATSPGPREIPPFTIRYRSGSGGKEDTLQTQPVRITIDGLQEGEAKGKLNPPTSVEKLPYDWTRRNLILAGLCVFLLAAAALAWWQWRRWNARREALKPPPPPRPAHLIAFEELDALENMQLIRQGKFKEFYTRLSDVLREYIQRRYQAPAMDLTTYELMLVLEHRAQPQPDQRRILGEILDSSDLAKFAKWTPPDGAPAESLEQSRRFVQSTRAEAPPCVG